MKLSTALAGLASASIKAGQDVEITGLSEDTRTIKKGDLFFARKGLKTSGAEFAREAVAKGASAVVSEEELTGMSAPVVWVKSVSEAESAISQKFYGDLSKKIKIIGVTGTNGKTTFTYLLEAVAKEAGKRAGVIGTINYRLPSQNPSGSADILPAPNTTPNILEVQALLHQMVQRKCDWAVMEVSSHALALGRVDPLQFHGAVFTNLTQDHLDFHKTMDNYFEAKAKLFKKISADGFSAVNSDDPYGEKLVKLSQAKTTTYGIENPSDVSAREIQLEPSGSRFVLSAQGKSAPVKLRLTGRHNVYNALAAAAAALRLDIPLNQVARGLEKMEAVPGRLEAVACGQDFTVLVDYAHTEDALKNVLESLRSLAKKRVLTLFGCGGDRDRSKRPLMGALAARLSDWVVVTSDNPRTEEPEKIALDIEAGIRRAEQKNYEVILDRAVAIRKILQTAQKDDIVLLAGKGHETYQIFKDRTIHFDDREIAREALCSR
ncbi:MAG: UDP-N-acetylmuramoyl-L-alanyl-D-glutamate--2,6-diaminopimelate ligase [Elusimicrobia bacterium RIFCSPLOWO2_01_FULL_54_10]|nr:MAG: UDP-N-acetylmuramoyl-L-alanyl-D-glutamate--2,6-diaminopimelate ligase [Elusimicrobia bacterium RIFCSPLOWO2_01_FULL_54_10]